MPALVTPDTDTDKKVFKNYAAFCAVQNQNRKKRAPNKSGALKKMQFETITL